jgi:hypothetical protein
VIVWVSDGFTVPGSWLWWVRCCCLNLRLCLGAEPGIFFRVGWNWTGLELRFVIGIQTRLGLGLFKKIKEKKA